MSVLPQGALPSIVQHWTRALAVPEGRAVLTGSQVYGRPTHKSDVDLVVLVDSSTRALLFAIYPPLPGLRARYGAQTTSLTVQSRGRPDLNLILVTTEGELEDWRRGTELLQREAARLGPVTRDRAVEVFEAIRAGEVPPAPTGGDE